MINSRRLSLFLAIVAALAVGAAPAEAQQSRPGREVTSSARRAPSRAFIKMDLGLPRAAHGLYVGQAAPVTIRAYFLGGTGVTMNGRPTIASDALMLSELSAEPRQSSTELRGLPYTVVTWSGVVTAVKEGAAKANIELPVELSYREAAKVSSARGSTPDPQDDQTPQDADDPFSALLRQSPFASDPLFAQMFRGHDAFGGMFADLAGTVRRRDVTLRDIAGTLNVAALPPNQPSGFSGAVGTFEISAALGSDTLRVGEPATMTLKVGGRGSFSRLAVSGLAPSDDVTTYGVTSSFTPGSAPLQGEKVFTQTVVPRRAGVVTLPSSTLTYFDPAERRYVTRSTAPLTVSIAANANDGGQSSTATDAPSRAMDSRTPSSTPVAAFLSGARRTSLTPAYRTRSYRIVAAAFALASLLLSGLGVMRGRGSLARAATARRIRREVAAQRRSMSAAAARGDAAALFAAGRAALQARLGATWGVPSDAIAAADVASRLGPRGERIREVFERADRAAYSRGRSSPNEDLNHWQSLISDELGSLEATS
jgi:hypothetical protein